MTRSVSSTIPLQKKILLRPQRQDVAEKIATMFDLSPVASRVIAARGYNADDTLKLYLNPSMREGLPQPDQLLNMDRACELIGKVISDGGGIAIACDFDVDGLSAGSQMLAFFNQIGVRCKVFVPDRFEDGYGLNSKIIDQIAEQDFKLLITLDFGTTNSVELEYARSLGINTIVVDHHHVGLHDPGADVFINPQQEGCGFANGILAAAGLAWYLVAGLRRSIPQAANVDPKAYLDLACLGTICDMVPLVGVNRIIAKRGLEVLSGTTRQGLIALKRIAGLEKSLSCHHVSFGIGPRINAAGRMISGEIVIELLTTRDEKRAHNIAARLDRLNKQRQGIEEDIKTRARLEVEKSGDVPPGLVLWSQDYHTGVIGIVAQRMVEHFYRPTAIMGMDKDGVYKGSVRGIAGFNVVEALTEAGDILIKFGGHAGAGGFSVSAERVEEFAEAFRAICGKKLKEIEAVPTIKVDTEITLDEVRVPVVRELQSFEPFGVGNASPLLLARDVEVKEISLLKDQHMKVQIGDGQRSIYAYLWRHNHHPALELGARVNMVFKPDLNEYQGNTSVQANIQAVERVG